MKQSLRLEEAAQFLLCIGGLIAMDVPWWAYVLLLIGPDIGMIGYLMNTRIGAATYNVFHHKGIAIALILVGFLLIPEGSIPSPEAMAWPTMAAGVILFGHASMDRTLGYGLKYSDAFKHTHLGWIGKGEAASGEPQVGK
jgi:hypothetical protein